MLENAGRGLNIMELGRSCVAPEYRTKHGIDLMWHGLGAMVSHYGIDAMMGVRVLPVRMWPRWRSL